MRSIGYLVLLTVLCAGFTSCQKEITGLVTITDSTNTGGGTIPGSTNGDLLIKSYGRSGADSNVTTYTYNSAKKLIATYNVMSANSGSTTYYGFERDSTGLIVRRKQFTTSGLFPASPDTSVTVYHYSTGTTKQILYSTSSITLGFSVDDSTVYTYNAAGKLTKTESYQSSILTGSPQLSMRNVFTYDATGNISTMVASGFLAGVLVSTITYTYTYDSKTVPQTYTDAEAIAISGSPIATHNLISLQGTTATAGNISSSFTYTYNTSNRPATGKQTVTQGTTTTITNYTFYYQ